MPITYTVAGDTRHEVWTGRVGAGELRAHWRAILGDAGALGCPMCFADLRPADLQFTGQQLKAAIESIRAPAAHLLQGQRVAILAASDAVYGVSRQYTALAEMLANAAVFRDEEAAWAWLRAGMRPGTD